MADLKERIKTRRHFLNKTLLEVAEEIGIKEATLQRYESGLIKNVPHDRIVDLAQALNCTPQYLMGWTDIPGCAPDDNITVLNTKLYNIPVYESASAGFGMAAIDSIVDYTVLPFTSKTEADESICIRVQGDSMSPKIENGDLIQVHKQSSVDSGDIAVVIVDGTEGFVKKVEYTDNSISLISFNPYYPPIVFNDSDVTKVMVVGKVKKVIRDL
jgi:repressor LexA